MKKIIRNDVVYAIYDHKASIEKTGSTWYGDNNQPLQASRMVYDGQKEFATHMHILNERTVLRTQEAMVCVEGIAEIKVYDEYKNYLDTIVLEKGDIGIFYKGYHGLKILCNGTILYEIKCGHFTSVEQDKEYYE